MATERQREVLAQMLKYGTFTTGLLAHECGISRPSASQLISRMEQAGLVEEHEAGRVYLITQRGISAAGFHLRQQENDHDN